MVWGTDQWGRKKWLSLIEIFRRFNIAAVTENDHVLIQHLETGLWHRVFCSQLDANGDPIDPHIVIEDTHISGLMDGVQLIVQDIITGSWHHCYCSDLDETAGHEGDETVHLNIEDTPTAAAPAAEMRLQNVETSSWHRVYCTTQDADGNTISPKLIIETSAI